MGFRRVSYLVPSCDGCGLAWAFGEVACADGIVPHFASRADALACLPGDYGWQLVPFLPGRPLMMCRRCAASGVAPDAAWRRWLLALTDRAGLTAPSRSRRDPLESGLPAGHPESLSAALPPEQEQFLAAIENDLNPDA